MLLSMFSILSIIKQNFKSDRDIFYLFRIYIVFLNNNCMNKIYPNSLFPIPCSLEELTSEGTKIN